MHGPGVVVWPNGTRYSGQIADGTQRRFGVFSYGAQSKGGHLKGGHEKGDRYDGFYAYGM